MKKILKMAVRCGITLFCAAFITNFAVAQTTQKPAAAPTTLPTEMQHFIQNSCAHCHMEPGNGMAMSKVNFSKWDSYDAKKQASKSNAVSKMVTKGKMPPKGFRADNPDKVPTEADKKMVQEWAASLQPK
jgi:cytochrome c5